MPELTPFAYNVIYNLLSLTVATMGAASLFFFFAPRVHERYRPAMIITGLVTAIACYHYFHIMHSFEGAFQLVNGMYVYSTANPFNDFYRYADWLLTVPLLMVELVAVLALAKSQSRALLSILIPATILMILLGYPGEHAISSENGNPAVLWGFFAASMVPFVIVLATLYTKLTAAIAKQPEQVRKLVGLARTVVLITWSFYPLAYVIGALGGKTATGILGLQIGYTIADITAKAGFGVVIYMIARAKSEHETQSESTTPNAQTALT